tara:strand:+ start:150 stop:443 length:294 start_codon:yes stop_codon:yes gene_type:complete
MAKIKELELSKGQLRKLNAYRKSVGGNETAAMQMFNIWLKNQPKRVLKSDVDLVAKQLSEALDRAFPRGLRLGNRGYTIKMARGRGVKKGFTVFKNG